MLDARRNVVPQIAPLTEEEFRSEWLVTLARLCRAHGDGKIALTLGVTERHLRNLKAGNSVPEPFRLWNLLALDQSAHDELDGKFDLKNVCKDAVCSTDPLTLDMIALAHETAEDESPDSPGGQRVTDSELLKKSEARIRKVRNTLDTWLDRIAKLRRPTVIRGGRA